MISNISNLLDMSSINYVVVVIYAYLILIARYVYFIR